MFHQPVSNLQFGRNQGRGRFNAGNDAEEVAQRLTHRWAGRPLGAALSAAVQPDARLLRQTHRLTSQTVKRDI